MIPSTPSTSPIQSLTRIRYLLAENAFSEIIIYEQRGTVGGIWDYTPAPAKRQGFVNGLSNQYPTTKAVDVVTANLPKLNTPMYEGLESNLPHMLMQYSDTPFPEGTQLFATRETVMQYLHDYASDLYPMIKFDHHVVDVRPTNGDEGHGWQVTASVTAEGKSKVERFDAVIAANGHCDWPLLPNVEGLEAWSEKFPDSLYHSVSYKSAKPFENKVSKYLVNLLVGLEGPSLISLAYPSRRRWPLRCRYRPSNRQSLPASFPLRADKEVSLPY